MAHLASPLAAPSSPRLSAAAVSSGHVPYQHGAADRRKTPVERKQRVPTMPHQKPRNPRSMEHAVALVIDYIGAAEAARVAGKSVKLVYAWSDDHSDSLPNVAQAMAMDAACKAAGHGTPIANAYEEVLGYAPAHDGLSPDASVRRLMSSVGRVCQHHEDALADGHYDGAERQQMVNFLYDVRDRIDHCIDVIGPTQAEVDKSANVTPFRQGAAE